MLYLSVLISFFTVLFLFYILVSKIFKDKIIIKDRMDYIETINNNSINSVEKTSLAERVIKPLYLSISKINYKFASSYKIELLNRKLEQAGIVLKNNTAEKWMFNKMIVMITLSTLFGLISFFVNGIIINALIIVLIMMVLINIVYRFYLSKRINLRQKTIKRDLPYTLDLITVSVEAGLSFDGAIAKVVNTINGELSKEFAKTLKEMRMGIEKRVALKNMSQRIELKELSMLITSIIQADELGISLGKVLRIESAGLRETIKQVAREKAMKAPVKMLFPLIFFIFPAIFVVLLGPIIIRMMEIL